jgi:hypothetical protein
MANIVPSHLGYRLCYRCEWSYLLNAHASVLS